MILCCRDSSCNLKCSTSLYFFLVPPTKKYKEMEDLRKQEESRQQRFIVGKENLVAAEAELEAR